MNFEYFYPDLILSMVMLVNQQMNKSYFCILNVEYQSTTAVKFNFYGLESKGWPAKMVVNAYKSMFNALMYSLK